MAHVQHDDDLNDSVGNLVIDESREEEEEETANRYCLLIFYWRAIVLVV